MNKRYPETYLQKLRSWKNSPVQSYQSWLREIEASISGLADIGSEAKPAIPDLMEIAMSAIYP